MSLGRLDFSSDRERRLWFWTVAVMIGIYSTLGSARTVVDELREQNLLRLSLLLGLLVVLGPLAWVWVRGRPDWREIAAVLSVAFVYWMVWIRIEGVEERTHLIEYGVVAALIHQALLERVRNGRNVPRPAAMAFGVTALLGLVDEGIQLIMPSRVFDTRDVFFNAVAAFMVIAGRLAISPQPRPGWRLWFLWLWAVAFGWGQGVYWGWFTDDEPKTLEAVPANLLAGYLGVVVGAVLIGVLQWLVLRRYLANASRWLVTSLAAVALVGAVIVGGGLVERDLGWFVGVSVFGPAAGVFQWLVLRQHLPRAGWWVSASTIGWAAGMPFGDLNGPPGLGAIYGAVTATALVWLVRQDPADRDSQPDPDRQPAAAAEGRRG